MFRVHYVEELPGGFTDTKVFFDFGDGIREEKKFFFVKEDADHYMNTSKLVYLNHMLCAFVRTSKRLIEDGNRQIYRTKKKIDAMVKCLALIERVKNMKLKDICLEIVSLEEDLEALIPVEGSSSHQLSYFQVKHLIRFAKKETGFDIQLSNSKNKHLIMNNEMDLKAS